MDDKVFMATVTTEPFLTKEQLEALAEHGWEAMPSPAEAPPASFLFRKVQSEDEAVVQFADLIKDVRLSGLRGLAWTPVENRSRGYAYLTKPGDLSAFFGGVLGAPQTPGKPGDPSKPGGAEGKHEKAAEEPQKAAAPKTETFPAIPEFLWKSLKPDNQDELAKKLVDYVINRPDTAAYSTNFEDAALFAHLEPGERAGLAKKVLEQKHGMTAGQVTAEGLVNEFQTERVNFMKQAVAAATEMNQHLKKWGELSGNALTFLVASTSVAAVFVMVSFALVFAGRISGWELAVLAFVFALMAVSPATLLLIGRPLKGLDEWSPNKQEKKAAEATEEPAKDKGKSEEKSDK